MLSILDADYHRQTWQEVRQLIQDNRIDRFERLPSDLRRYREYRSKLIKEYGSVMDFVMQERLKWTDLTPKGGPFQHPDDYKILYNDWPYGIDTRIVHLVIWTKFELQSVPITSENPLGDLTTEAREQIQDFVDKVFVKQCGRENVIWFKNWSALKSIHAIEHFHVMLLDPDPVFVRKVTEGDVPMLDKVGKPSEPS